MTELTLTPTPKEYNDILLRFYVAAIQGLPAGGYKAKDAIVHDGLAIAKSATRAYISAMQYSNLGVVHHNDPHHA